MAQNTLGYIYQHGEGVPVDYKKALHYFKLAAEGGSTMAYSNIGFMYGKGAGVTQSHEKAFQYYKVAAAKGDEGAQCNVGACYYHGYGVEKDISLAIKYFALSADQGYENAIKRLTRVLIDETKKQPKFSFQAIYRTKNALKIMIESDEDFTKFEDFLEWCKTSCGGCGASGKKETWQIQNLISKPELNGKMCEKVETLDNGRVKVKIDDLILSVKPECLLLNKIDLKTFCKCKVMYCCDFECFKKHWKERGHKDECKEIV